MIKFGAAQSIRRTEDIRLLTGTGRYTDDVQIPHMAHAYFLRSPHAHALIKSIDATAALAAPGVVAVFTGKDLAATGTGTLPCLAPARNRDGSKQIIPPRHAIAVDRVCYVGDTVAMIVADSLNEARDAADLVAVEYEPLPAVADTAGALAADAPLVHPDHKTNLSFDWSCGDEAKTAALFKQADRIVSLDLVNNRLVANSMETRGAIGQYSTADRRFTLNTSSQGGHGIRKVLADAIFKVPESSIRVLAGDVGGGFGMKIFLYPEHVAVLWAARAIGRAVKWTGERSDAFITDAHGRDHVTTAQIALRKDGKFLAIRVDTVANLGAYVSHYGPLIPTVLHGPMLCGVYTFETGFYAAKGVHTNTVPVDAYRGAGRPEAAYVIERMVDHVAREIGMAPDALRRINFAPPAAMPYTSAFGNVYDSGDFARNLDDAVKAADWSGFPARKAASQKAGRLRGIGMSYYIEACGGGPDESAQIRFDPSGGVTLLIGNQTNGQGHETAYAQLVSDFLGVPMDSVRLVQGDTDQVVYGHGTGGSRALSVAGSALMKASERIVEKGRKLAAHLLEAAEADIEFVDGSFAIAGTDRRKTIIEIAKASFDMANLPPGLSPGLEEAGNFVPPANTFPNGCHICEVEVDPATGTTDVVTYTVVDDFGRVMNPMLVQGQVHGGIGQGIGQALLEGCVYDPESGQILTGSFMDYTMPRADDVPSYAFSYNEIPCTTNPLGVKGCGEAGAIGAPPAVIAAVVDALAGHGVKHVDMPATPEKVWRLVNGGAMKAAAE